MNPIDTCDEKLFDFLKNENNQVLLINKGIRVTILKNGKNGDVRFLDPLTAGKYQKLEMTDNIIKFTYDDLKIEIIFPNENAKEDMLNNNEFSRIIRCFESNKVMSSFDIEPSEKPSKPPKWSLKSLNPFKLFGRGGRKTKKSKRSKRSKRSRKSRRR